MRQETLLETFRSLTSIMTAKDVTRTRRAWHYAVTVILHALGETSDPLPEPRTRTAIGEDGKPYKITTIPFGPFFKNRPIEELRELYRVVKPRIMADDW